MAVEFRDDVTFHNGDKMTAEDFRYTFFERIKAGHKLDTANSWRKVSDIEIASPTKAVMKFNSPGADRSAMAGVPRQLYRAEKLHGIGRARRFREKPIGTGPYKLVEYQLNSRIVLERNDKYWGPKPKMRARHLRDHQGPVRARGRDPVRPGRSAPSTCRCARSSACSRRPSLAAELNPITRVILLQVRNDLGFADQNVRLAAHHAIDKQALSKAFYGGAAVPLSVVATPGTPGYLDDFKFDYDPELAKAAAGQIGLQPRQAGEDPLRIHQRPFPERLRHRARASCRCGRRSASTPSSKPSNTPSTSSSTAAAKLPEATLYSWDNATGDPEIFAGYLLNPKMPFSAMEGTWNRRKGARRCSTCRSTRSASPATASSTSEAVESGATIPLLQSVQTLVRKKNLNYAKYGNGWILASNRCQWS